MKTVTRNSLTGNILNRVANQISAIRTISGDQIIPLSSTQETFLLLYFAYFLTADQERAISLVKEVRPKLDYVVDLTAPKCFHHWFFGLVQKHSKDYSDLTAGGFQKLRLKQQRLLENELRSRESILLVELQKAAKTFH